MTLKMAFAGFRHGHIFSLLNHARRHPDIEVVASSEEDPDTSNSLREEGRVEITHDSLGDILSSVDCDAVATGDAYGRRGPMMIAALKAGKHVIADKPPCTRLEEWDEIAALAGDKGLKVGCMLDMRDAPRSIGARRLIRSGIIGDVQQITFGGQHPLNRGTRPSWYFEPGMHGGTINDIAIHSLDLLPWMTGRDPVKIIAARTWNAFAAEVPAFQDSAQFMLEMDNGGGILGDVSYAMPDSQGYKNPFYWRITFFGLKGVLEIKSASAEILMILDGDKQPRTEPVPEGRPGGFLQDFLNDINGCPTADGLDTAAVLRASRRALEVQAAAESRAVYLPLQQ